jgi:UDP-N-acetylmuramyl pentapeptide phosphotransferase/UDP-N-acetylglucosamine-1-phosphate transferase
MPLLLTFFASLILASASAPAWRALLRGPGWVDHPRPDRHHLRPVSRAGGICWVTGVLGGLLVWWTSGGDGPRALVLSSATLLALALGLADDRVRMGPARKWGGQTLLLGATVVGLALLEGNGAFAGPSRSGVVPAAAAVLLLQTALQTFDNLDGALALVSSAAFAALACAGGIRGNGGAALAGCGASVGFLLWNRPPARMFLGNGGSQAVALLLCVLLLERLLPSGGSDAGGGRAAWLFLPLAWPLADLVFVIAARLLRGDAPWCGGRDHTTHRLARALGSDGRAAGLIALFSVAGLALACGLLGGPR